MQKDKLGNKYLLPSPRFLVDRKVKTPLLFYIYARHKYTLKQNKMLYSKYDS